MADQWQWADLTAEQLNKVMHAEKTLGNNVKYLLAYEQAEGSAGGNVDRAPDHRRIAPLTASQIECLQGLEKQLNAVVIAYQ